MDERNDEEQQMQRLAHRDLVQELLTDREQLETVMRDNASKMQEIAERLGFLDEVCSRDAWFCG